MTLLSKLSVIVSALAIDTCHAGKGKGSFLARNKTSILTATTLLAGGPGPRAFATAHSHPFPKAEESVEAVADALEKAAPKTGRRTLSKMDGLGASSIISDLEDRISALRATGGSVLGLGGKAHDAMQLSYGPSNVHQKWCRCAPYTTPDVQNFDIWGCIRGSCNAQDSCPSYNGIKYECTNRYVCKSPGRNMYATSGRSSWANAYWTTSTPLADGFLCKPSEVLFKAGGTAFGAVKEGSGATLGASPSDVYFHARSGKNAFVVGSHRLVIRDGCTASGQGSGCGTKDETLAIDACRDKHACISGTSVPVCRINSPTFGHDTCDARHDDGDWVQKGPYLVCECP